MRRENKKTKLYRKLKGNWILMDVNGYTDDKVNYYKKKFGENVLTEDEHRILGEKKNVVDKKKG